MKLFSKKIIVTMISVVQPNGRMIAVKFVVNPLITIPVQQVIFLSFLCHFRSLLIVEINVTITRDLKIRFLEEIVIPSFGSCLGLSNDAKRDIWMKKRAHQKKISRWECEELMILFGTISSLDKAEAKLDKESEDRDKEREFFLAGISCISFNLLIHKPSLKN